MKALLIALSLLAGQAWGAIADNTTGLYDFEDNLTDSSGLGNNASLGGGSAVYQTDGAWHGSKAFSSSSGGWVSVPTGALATAGTLEASFRSPASPANSKALWSCWTSSGTRAIEIYYFAGKLWAYGNGAGGTNTEFQIINVNTNYYIKDTWDGSNGRQIWVGEWTTAGTVTLTKKFDSTGASAAGAVEVLILQNKAINGSDWAVDWVRFRNVHDNSATVTVDPSGANVAPAPITPYNGARKTNLVTPQWWRLGAFLRLLSPSTAYAVITDERKAQTKANTKFAVLKAAEFSLVKAKWTPTASPTPGEKAKATPTPTATPTP